MYHHNKYRTNLHKINFNLLLMKMAYLLKYYSFNIIIKIILMLV
jgi:hypothetical protein